MRSLLEDEVRRKPEIELGPDAEPMDLFYLVMRNNSLPLSTRMRAAERIADFKYPKKQAIAVIPAAGDLGTQIEGARKRTPMSLNDLTPEEYEAVMSARSKATPVMLASPAVPTDLSARPMVSDRRFRK
jgi:hypothetical protein